MRFLFYKIILLFRIIERKICAKKKIQFISSIKTFDIFKNTEMIKILKIIIFKIVENSYIQLGRE